MSPALVPRDNPPAMQERTHAVEQYVIVLFLITVFRRMRKKMALRSAASA